MPELELGDRVGGGESLGPILYEKLKNFDKIFFFIFEKYFFVREKIFFSRFFQNLIHFLENRHYENV